jgi:hypothetical protein
MKYKYTELNNKAQMKARLDYFDKHSTTEGMLKLFQQASFTANGDLYE